MRSGLILALLMLSACGKDVSNTALQPSQCYQDNFCSDASGKACVYCGQVNSAFKGKPCYIMLVDPGDPLGVCGAGGGS